MIITDFGDLIAERLRVEHRELARRWFERLLDLLPVDAREVFPSEQLLDHIPALILELSDHLGRPEDATAIANTTIVQKARELGELRHQQKASLHQVLREYQLLNNILVTFVADEIDRLGLTPTPSEAVMLTARVQQGVNVLSQATVETFVTLYTQTIAEQNERLDQFTRMATHEWRQPLSALRAGVSLLRLPDDGPRSEKALQTVERNVQKLIDLTHRLEIVARVRSTEDDPVTQEVSLGTIAQEAARQLREMADARGVRVQIADDLPTITVDVGRLELVFINLLSNAIKYSDPAKTDRFVSVRSAGMADDGSCRVAVEDNGLGIPAAGLNAVFRRFTRAHVDRDPELQVTGVGLGLSIVDECVRAMKGRIGVESVERRGTTFTLELPLCG